MSDDRLVAAWHTVITGAARAQARIDESLDNANVPAVWFPVLHLLLSADEHRLPMSVLARDVSMSSGGFTKLADRMAREGVIDRRGSAADRRVVNAALTDKGFALARHATAVYRDALHEFVLGVVAERELDAAAQVLGALSGAHAPDGRADRASEYLISTPDPAQPDRRGRGRSNEGV